MEESQLSFRIQVHRGPTSRGCDHGLSPRSSLVRCIRAYHKMSLAPYHRQSRWSWQGQSRQEGCTHRDLRGCSPAWDPYSICLTYAGTREPARSKPHKTIHAFHWIAAARTGAWIARLPAQIASRSIFVSLRKTPAPWKWWMDAAPVEGLASRPWDFPGTRARLPHLYGCFSWRSTCSYEHS